MQKLKIPAMLLLLSFMAVLAFATVSEYSFASSLGTFTEITGGTILGTATNDNESFNAIPLGFTFSYNGVDYTEVSVQTNGFLAMGPVVLTSNQAISNAATTNNVVAALSRDIKSRDTGELMYLLSGTAPSRIFTVQWKHYRRTPTSTANDDFSFQIQLKEEGNKVSFVYGAFSTVTATAAAAIQVGLRGDTNQDFNNRTTTTDWSATTAGTVNTNSCTLSATVFPANGLSFVFTPPATGEPPTPAQNPNPANNATNVSIYSNLSWAAGSGIIDGYKVYLGTDNPPTNIANGTQQTALSFDAPDFTYSTTYYWKIVPFNANGDALDCPVWSFTTLADPTVSTFPWSENFDAPTPPTLPPGWLTINANNDTYTWETYAGNAQTAPNSVRIRYNGNLAMNDWLIMPPMQLNQNTNYKVRFYYRASTNTLPEKLALYWGNAPTIDGLSNQIFSADSITTITYLPAEVIVTPTTNGVYYFGFKGYSDPDMFYLYLDSVSISVWVEVLNPPRNLAAAVDEHDVHLSWDAPIVSRALLGYNVYRNSTLIASIPHPDTLAYHDLDLASGLYSYSVTAIYTSGESVPAGPVLVDVDPIILPPINLTAQVVERDVTLHWNNPEGDWFTWTNMTTGNSVGTNSAIIFDIAHRWTHEDLTPYLGRSISRIEFIPIYNNCTYTLKVWTGGSATDAGTLVHSQVVSNPVMNEWNTVFLTALIPIPATGELYYGVECNTLGGYPAAADEGPQVEGKGNMMYFQGQWQTLTQVASDFTYNWSIRAFAQYGTPATALAMQQVPEQDLPYATGELGCQRFNLTESERNITGYKVYRDGNLIATLNNEETIAYTDPARPNATYNYSVTSVSPNGDSEPASIEVVVNFQLALQIFADDFEAHADFAETFGSWTIRDVDNAPTAGIPGYSFPGSGEPTGYMVFNPSSTTPAYTTLIPHSGSKMAAAFAATTMVNNDWIISPRVHLGTNSRLKLFARSLNNDNGLERFRIGVCPLPTIIVQGFQYVTGPDYVEAPLDWTEYVFDISAYNGQNVYIGIRCVSDSAAVFLVDDVSIHSDDGYIVDNDDPTVPSVMNALHGNYPNPFNPETTIRYSLAEKAPVQIDIYNLKGQLVRNLVNESKSAGNYSAVFDGRDNHGLAVASGVYFYKMHTGKFSATRKMILMK